MCKEAQVVEEAAVETAENVTETAAAAAEAAAAETPTESMESYAAELEESIKQGPPNDDPVWDKFETMLKEKTIFPVKVDSAVKAGVVAYVDDIRGFIPASKLSTGYVENLEDFKGKTVEVVVITADKENKKLVLSAREAIKLRQKEAKAAAMEACKVGDVMEGTVDSLMEYGAFIDLDNGLSGLLHVSQISYKRVEKPSDVLKKGERVQVKLIAIKEGKLSLSMKALQEAPARSGDRPSRGPRDHRDREERDFFNYKETGKATTSLGDLLKGVKLD
ncbi:MAG: S1 RNA-binding domain-containing protein [Lachnospiraceae bacterium]|nr:S1 RNA-binding domain-containing protein [Lachnospiraceae bacterium]